MYLKVGTRPNEGQKLNGIYRKFVNLGKKLIPIFVSANIVLTSLSGCTPVNANTQTNIGENQPSISQEQQDESYEDIPEVEEYDFKEIEEIIKNNPNLTDEEKEFLYKLQFVFDEEHQYMNLGVIKDRLKDLKIIYENNQHLNDNNRETLAEYYIDKNIIKMYKSQSFDDCNKQALIHEFVHVLQVVCNYNRLLELSTQQKAISIVNELIQRGIVNSEMFTGKDGYIDYGNGYEYDMPVYNILMKILPESVLNDYNYVCDQKAIAYALTDIDKEEGALEKAYELIDTIDELGYYGDKGKNDEYREMKEKAIELLEDYFEKANNGKRLRDDLASVMSGIQFGVIEPGDVEYVAAKEVINDKIYNPSDVKRLFEDVEVVVTELGDNTIINIKINGRTICKLPIDKDDERDYINKKAEVQYHRENEER